MKTRLWMFLAWPYRRLRVIGTGYFWLPCPLCRMKFSGKEWVIGGNLSSSINYPGQPGRGRGICPACTAEGLGEPDLW